MLSTKCHAPTYVCNSVKQSGSDCPCTSKVRLTPNSVQRTHPLMLTMFTRLSSPPCPQQASEIFHVAWSYTLSTTPQGPTPSPKSCWWPPQHKTPVQAGELFCMQLPSALQVLHQYHRSTEGGSRPNPTAPLAAPEDYEVHNRAGDRAGPAEAGAGNQEAEMVAVPHVVMHVTALSLCEILLLAS